MTASKGKKIGWIFGLAIVIGLGWWLHQPAPKISTLIVPHHDLVKEQRSELFAYLRGRIQGRRIILLSPNHYDSGAATMQTTSQAFTTQYGNVPIDQALLKVAKQHGVTETPVTFEAEHGIRTILPDLAKYAPKTTVLPLVIKETASQSRVDELMADLYKSCSDCLVVASVDFSHYQPYELSELHDDLTRRAMRAMDREAIETKSEIGEPRVLSAAMKWAELNDTKRFKEFNHTNATKITNNFYAEGTTHFFAWYETGQPVAARKEASFTFVGDIMFDRGIRQRFHPNYQNVTKQLGNRVLWGTDMVMGNLEGPITTEPTVPSEQAKPRFSFSPLVRHTLEDLHFTHMNVRNNHVFDAGRHGFEDTLQVLQNISLTAMYKPKEPQIVTDTNQRIITFSLDAAQNDSLTQADLAPYQGKDDNIVIYVHWGPEYAKKPDITQQTQAHQWIEWGADLVIGTGAHVLQPVEVYKDRPIVYALGNFIFDMTDNARTSTGMILTGKFTEQAIILEPMLTTHYQYAPILVRTKEGEAVVEQYFEAMKPWLQQKKGGLLFSIPK